MLNMSIVEVENNLAESLSVDQKLTSSLVSIHGVGRRRNITNVPAPATDNRMPPRNTYFKLYLKPGVDRMDQS